MGRETISVRDVGGSMMVESLPNGLVEVAFDAGAITLTAVVCAGHARQFGESLVKVADESLAEVEEADPA